MNYTSFFIIATSNSTLITTTDCKLIIKTDKKFTMSIIDIVIYCSQQNRNILTLWTEKLEDKIHIVTNADDIIVALLDEHCVDVYMYADLNDKVSKELMSRGIPMGREKLKWWQFVKEDKTPDHVIDVNGFCIVQVEGDPNDFDTHQLGVLKAEFPVGHYVSYPREDVLSSYIINWTNRVLKKISQELDEKQGGNEIVYEQGLVETDDNTL